MTFSCLAGLFTTRPRFSQICPCSLFFLGYFSDCPAILLVFSGHLSAHKNMSHSVMLDWSSPSHSPLKDLVLFILS